jgi:hypothetical protein
MVALPVDRVTDADILEWQKAAADLALLKSKESLLRARVFRGMFAAPVEGTNTVSLSGGYVLKGKYTINRKLDEALLQSLGPSLHEQGIPMASLIKMEPALVLRSYRELTAEQQKLFDQILDIKPGSPALEIVLPKRAAAAGA